MRNSESIQGVESIGSVFDLILCGAKTNYYLNL